MSLDKILVLFFGFLAILFTFWFFFMKKEEELVESREGEIDILVEGGYKPNKISIPQGKKVKLNFLRKDPSSCLEELVIADFRIRKFLPLGEKTTIEIKADKKGEFDFSCGMGMFHGKIIIK